MKDYRQDGTSRAERLVLLQPYYRGYLTFDGKDDVYVAEAYNLFLNNHATPAQRQAADARLKTRNDAAAFEAAGKAATDARDRAVDRSRNAWRTSEG